MVRERRTRWGDANPASEPTEPSGEPTEPPGEPTEPPSSPPRESPPPRYSPPSDPPPIPPQPLQLQQSTMPLIHHVLVENSLIGNTERIAPRYTRLVNHQTHQPARLLIPYVAHIEPLVRNTAQYLAHADEKAREPIRMR